MRYNGFMPNDFVNGEGVCVSLWTQGCPHKCPNCFNPETWDKHGGNPVPNDLSGRIIKAISANGVTRNFSVLGGEPLAPWNLELVNEIISKVKIAYPNIKIFLWTGYTMNQLKNQIEFERDRVYSLNKDKEIVDTAITSIGTLEKILNKIDVLIDGPFIQEKKDLTLKLRGSSNQHIYRRVNGVLVQTDN